MENALEKFVCADMSFECECDCANYDLDTSAPNWHHNLNTTTVDSRREIIFMLLSRSIVIYKHHMPRTHLGHPRGHHPGLLWHILETSRPCPKILRGRDPIKMLYLCSVTKYFKIQLIDT